tara:strand:- start:96 stop:734 length:639 start_codon:yes stop_codon:yes gene_type:complete
MRPLSLLLTALPLCAADVALVDIRGTGTPSEAILKQSLASTYGTAGIPGAGVLLPTSDMTLNTAISGSYILEVDSSQATASELDNFWCLHSAQKGLFSTMVETLGGLTVTEIVTCIGESGESCTASTTCSGGGDSGTTPEPEGDDNGGISALAIVLIVVGAIVAIGVALYLAWPMISPHLKQSSALTTRLTTRGTTATKAGGAELPPLFSPI